MHLENKWKLITVLKYVNKFCASVCLPSPMKHYITARTCIIPEQRLRAWSTPSLHVDSSDSSRRETTLRHPERDRRKSELCCNKWSVSQFIYNVLYTGLYVCVLSTCLVNKCHFSMMVVERVVWASEQDHRSEHRPTRGPPDNGDEEEAKIWPRNRIHLPCNPGNCRGEEMQSKPMKEVGG